MIRIAFYGGERLAADRVGDYLLRKILDGLTGKGGRYGPVSSQELEPRPDPNQFVRIGAWHACRREGLTCGTGPRGKYLHAGGEGLYHSTSLDTYAEQATDNAVQEASNAELDTHLSDLTEEDQLAAARWARITARSERVRGAEPGDERGFFSRLLRGIFGELPRGR